MSCEFCGKEIRKDEEFILTGKFPSIGRIWFRSGFVRWAPPQVYGKIYHKACFLEILKKEIAKKKGVKP